MSREPRKSRRELAMLEQFKPSAVEGDDMHDLQFLCLIITFYC
jgi:hypothetical protein